VVYWRTRKKEVLLDELAERPSEAYVEDLERTQQQQWQQTNKCIFCYYSSSSCSEAPMVPLVARVNTGPNVAPLSLLTLITGVSLV
jgi:succinate dehydrogenase/fumarate reductase-like Fe-S protein